MESEGSVKNDRRRRKMKKNVVAMKRGRFYDLIWLMVVWLKFMELSETVHGTYKCTSAYS